MMSQNVEARPVSTKKDLRTFIRFPWKIYKNDPNWVPPLLGDLRAKLDPQKRGPSPFDPLELYIAWRQGQPVGTIAVFVDKDRNQFLERKIAGFGFFESINDQQVADALLNAACSAARSWGMHLLRGPTNFGPHDEPGVLVQSVACPPALLEAHTPLYYADLLTGFGMTKYLDNYAWRVALQELGPNLEKIPEQVRFVFEKAREREDINIRSVRMDHWDEDLAIVHSLFNETLLDREDLTMHVPLNLEEFRRLADPMRMLLDPDLALIAEMDGAPVAFLVAIPDPNRILLHMNGRIFPFGWLKLLWYRKRIDVISFKLFGVRREFRRRGIDVLLYYQAVKNAAAKGYRWLDGSLTSELNSPVVRLADRMGAERYKTYRQYDYTL
jgi:GNAT superfamily N-acetyltransferase